MRRSSFSLRCSGAEFDVAFLGGASQRHGLMCMNRWISRSWIVRESGFHAQESCGRARPCHCSKMQMSSNFHQYAKASDPASKVSLCSSGWRRNGQDPRAVAALPRADRPVSMAWGLSRRFSELSRWKAKSFSIRLAFRPMGGCTEPVTSRAPSASPQMPALLHGGVGMAAGGRSRMDRRPPGGAPLQGGARRCGDAGRD